MKLAPEKRPKMDVKKALFMPFKRLVAEVTMASEFPDISNSLKPVVIPKKVPSTPIEVNNAGKNRFEEDGFFGRQYSSGALNTDLS
jgi:hypothetical protein